MSLLSVIVPCFNEQESIPFFYQAITETAAGMQKTWEDLEFEFLFIDDGSKDNTLAIVESLREKDTRVRFVSFSRNFGKEAALYAGLSNAKGDYAVTMDVDMQDPPALLPELYKAVTEEGYDSAATRRVTRKGEPVIRSFFARRFYRLINRMSSADIVDGARDYRIIAAAVIYYEILDLIYPVYMLRQRIQCYGQGLRFIVAWYLYNKLHITVLSFVRPY